MAKARYYVQQIEIDKVYYKTELLNYYVQLKETLKDGEIIQKEREWVQSEIKRITELPIE